MVVLLLVRFAFRNAYICRYRSVSAGYFKYKLHKEKNWRGRARLIQANRKAPVNEITTIYNDGEQKRISQHSEP